MKMQDDIQRLKDEIAEAKQEKAEAEGVIKTLMARLKKDFGLDDLQAAKKEVENLEDQVKQVNTELATRFKELKNNYEW